jgi:hypothetical protein
VQFAVPDAGVSAGLNTAPGEFSGERSPAGISGPAVQTGANATSKSVAVRAALKAGMLGVFIGIIPLLGIVLTGALGAFFYRRESGLTLPAAVASRVGAAAGVVAFAINSVLLTIQVFVFHAQQKYTDDVMAIVQRLGGNGADPDMQASIHNLFTPAGMAVTFFFGLILSVLLASLGGAAASWFLRPGNKRP